MSETDKGLENLMAINALPDRLLELARKIEPPSRKARRFRSVIILGFARSGKSTLSGRLSKKIGASVFPIDQLRKHQAYSDPAVRLAFFNLLLKTYPSGLIIEGDNLVGENKSGSAMVSPHVFVEAVASLKRQGAEVVAIGNAEAGVPEKSEAILSYRQENMCWTTKAGYSASEIWDLSRRSIAYSKALRDAVPAGGHTYLEIRPRYFCRDIAKATRQVIRLISA